MRVIVLGAKGQLGAELVKVLASKGHDLISVNRDLLDATSATVESDLAALLPSDVVINCMAYVRVDDAETEDALAMKVNAVFPYHLARFCSRTGRLLIHFSTDYVFSGRKGEAYISSDATDPINVYGLSKAAGETAVAGNASRYHILRVSAIYGKVGSSGKGGNFVETMLKLAQKQNTLRIVSDQVTSPTHCYDVANAVAAILEKGTLPNGIYHCASRGSCSWFEFAKEIFKLTGVEIALEPISTASFNAKAPRPAFSALSSYPHESEFAMPSWQDGLAAYLAERRK